MNITLIVIFILLTFTSFFLDSLYDRIEVSEIGGEHVTTVRCNLIQLGNTVATTDADRENFNISALQRPRRF